MQMFIQTTVAITGGACVISSTLNHNYSHIKGMIHASGLYRCEKSRRQDPGRVWECLLWVWLHHPSGLVMKDHFLCGEMSHVLHSCKALPHS